MSYELLYVHRLTKRSDDSMLGHMYLMDSTNKGWKHLCYSYELPFKTDALGKTKSNVSAIAAATYKMEKRTHVSSNGSDKGWRLELLNTGHRTNVQVHRASANLYIQGCILPITASGASGGVKAKAESVELMQKIKTAYLAFGGETSMAGKPAITIAYKKPPK